MQPTVCNERGPRSARGVAALKRTRDCNNNRKGSIVFGSGAKGSLLDDNFDAGGGGGDGGLEARVEQLADELRQRDAAQRQAIEAMAAEAEGAASEVGAEVVVVAVVPPRPAVRARVLLHNDCQLLCL